MFLTAAIHVVLARFGQGEGIVGDLVHFEEDGMGGNEEPSACLQTVGRVVRQRRRHRQEVGGGTC